MTSGLQFFDMGPSLIYLHGHKYHMKTQKIAWPQKHGYIGPIFFTGLGGIR